MRKLRELSVLIILSLSLVLMNGCGDDGVQPTLDYAGVHGIVVDADGQPLPDVAIGVIYTFPDALVQNSVIVMRPPAKPTTLFGFELPDAGEVSLQIFDYAGNLARVLMNGELPAGPHQVMWDGRDDDGDLVASGMYYFRLQIGDEAPEASQLFMMYSDPVSFLTAPNAVTDRAGVFLIPDNLIPVGESMTMTDESGATVGEFSLSAELTIVAIREGDPSPVWKSLELVYQTGGRNGSLRFVLP